MLIKIINHIINTDNVLGFELIDRNINIYFVANNFKQIVFDTEEEAKNVFMDLCMEFKI